MKKTLVLALAAIMVLGVAGAAFAGSATIDGTSDGGTPPVWSAAGTVNVNAQVNPKITLTITTPDGSGTDLLLDWATTPLNPGDDPAAKVVTLAVQSNKAYNVYRDATDMTDLAGLNIAYSMTSGVAGAKPGATHTDSVNPGVVSYDLAPDTLLTGTLVYTAVQQ